MIFNRRKTIETDEKPETSSQSVSQPSSNASTSASVEGTSVGPAKETESKEGNTGDVADTVNSSSNELATKATKEADNLKRPSVEKEDDDEIKPKKRKEDHNQNSKGTFFFKLNIN